MNKNLGYYTVGDLEFKSKVKALIHAQKFGGTPSWHFNESVFDSYLWSVEPELSLDELYNARAREIRQAYDYVVVSYSGGSDSHNVVESFLRQGLHVDEIVSNWAFDISEKFLDLSGRNRDSSNNNAEFKLNAQARLADIQKRSPKTKITVNDTSKKLIAGLLTKDDPTWVYDRNDVLNVTGVTNYNVLQHGDLRKTLDKDLKIAFVVGLDKPKLRVVDNSLFVFFQDKTVNMITVNEHIIDYTNTSVELFYWSPTAADLVCKQAHTVLKTLSVKPELARIWRGVDYAAQRTIGEEVLKTLLYSSTWNPSWFQVKKTLGDWDSEIDYWFTRGMRDSQEHKNWVAGLEFLAPQISKFLMMDCGVLRGTKFFLSKDYFIGNLNADYYKPL